MADAIFEDPRLEATYDVFDGHRDDLDLYVALVAEAGATIAWVHAALRSGGWLVFETRDPTPGHGSGGTASTRLPALTYPAWATSPPGATSSPSPIHT